MTLIDVTKIHLLVCNFNISIEFRKEGSSYFSTDLVKIFSDEVTFFSSVVIQRIIRVHRICLTFVKQVETRNESPTNTELIASF